MHPRHPRRNADLALPLLPLICFTICFSLSRHASLLVNCRAYLCFQSVHDGVTARGDQKIGLPAPPREPCTFAQHSKGLHTNTPDTPAPIQNIASATDVFPSSTRSIESPAYSIHRVDHIFVRCLTCHVRATPVFATSPLQRHQLPATTRRTLLSMDGRFTPHSAHSDDALAQNLQDPMFEPQPSYNFADSHSKEPRGLQPTMGSPYAPNHNQQTFFNPVDGTRLVFRVNIRHPHHAVLTG